MQFVEGLLRSRVHQRTLLPRRRRRRHAQGRFEPEHRQYANPPAHALQMTLTCPTRPLHQAARLRRPRPYLPRRALPPALLQGRVRDGRRQPVDPVRVDRLRARPPLLRPGFVLLRRRRQQDLLAPARARRGRAPAGGSGGGGGGAAVHREGVRRVCRAGDGERVLLGSALHRGCDGAQLAGRLLPA
jgi:hypothetical protein